MTWDDTVSYWRALGLSARSANCLTSESIRTLDQLRAIPDERLARIPNLGRKSMAEISVLKSTGFISPINWLKVRTGLHVLRNPTGEIIARIEGAGSTGWRYRVGEGEWSKVYGTVTAAQNAAVREMQL